MYFEMERRSFVSGLIAASPRNQLTKRLAVHAMCKSAEQGARPRMSARSDAPLAKVSAGRGAASGGDFAPIQKGK
jgi:hypothetical protein